jgi:D-beta-D-heptose 7-phosphate kinase/D-beta-D-heptose 1-phosphate adenosyltransferase
MVIHKDMFDDEEKRPTVMVSGGFDPVHVGHIRMIRDASEFGDVIVIANSDDWLHRKKGFNFMDFKSRYEILDAIKGVILVDSVNDSDGTVCDALRRHKPTYFANGGVRGKENTPEVLMCKELGVELLWGIGGEEEIGSSPDLIKKTRDFETPPHRSSTKHSER